MIFLKNYQALLSITLYTLIVLGTASSTIAQEDVYLKKLAKFSILVESSGDEIKLTCNDGCTWKQLSFNSSIKNDPQAVDKFGMTAISSDLVKKDSLNGDFLFTIKRTQELVSLEGKAGTMWPSLTFDCAGGHCIRTIDEYGMKEHSKK